MRTLLALSLIACAPADNDENKGPDTQDTEDTDTDWQPPGSGRIQLTTRDDVTIVADYYPSETEAASAVVLLHMIPPNWDRTSWPSSFISTLTDRGWSVVVPDRRGAGESGGVALDAYQGEKGKYDVEACTQKLADDGYGDIAIIGASNGTTSTIDYAIWAGGEGLPQPVALGFMTGGTYTEAQNAMEDVPDVPAIFTYSTAERAWSVDQQELGRTNWQFEEYADGAHGTQMFEADPSVIGDLDAFLAGVL